MVGVKYNEADLDGLLACQIVLISISFEHFGMTDGTVGLA